MSVVHKEYIFNKTWGPYVNSASPGSSLYCASLRTLKLVSVLRVHLTWMDTCVMTPLNFPKPSCAGTKFFRCSAVYPNKFPSTIFGKCFLCCYMGWFPSDDNTVDKWFWTTIKERVTSDWFPSVRVDLIIERKNVDNVLLFSLLDG